VYGSDRESGTEPNTDRIDTLRAISVWLRYAIDEEGTTTMPRVIRSGQLPVTYTTA
jgi:hypothetical protein